MAHLQSQRTDGEDKRDANAVPDLRVGQDTDIVAQTDKLWRLDNIIGGEAQIKTDIISPA